jgi:hypothetical protein
MLSLINQLATAAKVNVFRRFDLMRRFLEVERHSFDTIIDPRDETRLHQSDFSAGRIGYELGETIAAAAANAGPIAGGLALRQRPQVPPQAVGIGTVKKALDLRMGTIPDRDGRCQQRPAGRCQRQQPGAPVLKVNLHFDESSTLQRFQRGRQRGPVHRQHRGHSPHRRRFLAVERGEQRELSVGQPERPQRVVEPPPHHARGALYMQAQAMIADVKRGGERNFGGL